MMNKHRASQFSHRASAFTHVRGDEISRQMGISRHLCGGTGGHRTAFQVTDSEEPRTLTNFTETTGTSLSEAPWPLIRGSDGEFYGAPNHGSANISGQPSKLFLAVLANFYRSSIAPPRRHVVVATVWERSIRSGLDPRRLRVFQIVNLDQRDPRVIASATNDRGIISRRQSRDDGCFVIIGGR
jgi:hypothetical protein